MNQYNSIKISFIGLKEGGDGIKKLDQYGISNRVLGLKTTFKTKQFIKNLIVLRKAIISIDPEIVISLTFWPNVLCGLVWKFTSIKKFFWCQRDSGVHFKRNIWSSLAFYMSTKAISNSISGAEFLRTQFRVGSQKIKIIHNGYDIPQNKSNLNQKTRLEKFGIKPDRNIFLMIFQPVHLNTRLFLMISNFHANKDFITLIKTWILLKKRLLKVPLLILAGRKSDYSDFIEKKIKDSKLEEHIKIIDFVSDIEGLIKACNFFIFSSFKEGLPNLGIEAML